MVRVRKPVFEKIEKSFDTESNELAFNTESKNEDRKMNVFKVKENDDTPTPLKFGLANIRSFCDLSSKSFPRTTGQRG